ncbi:hypothetical protein CcI49_05170 [Frankia sp. CcI49]|uniref:TetR/AcrR family transcriptional regulator n=1 Tax=unclassified Frankia TaxID=2632575 RepID=UPI0006CA119C|nr:MULTISPECIES: TetR/AcrR family transcriptional regulator [unclassified Frankia]KPM54179.1 hypothetical protein ACG83_19415 [Frankia sp. R43]ONH61609.1 hypothetical protein CcI49_05170 [Frankia sp. CcI49]
MHRGGWAGDPPATDEEAAARIVAAARACIEVDGTGSDLAKVARRVGVTRQTVYRYFPTRRALFEAVAEQGVEALVAGMAASLTGVDDPRDALVRLMLHCVRTLPNDPGLSFIAQPGRGDALITTADAPRLTLAVLDRLPIALDLGEQARAALAEHMVRLLQSLLLDETTQLRSDEDLGVFLHACLDHHVA